MATITIQDFSCISKAQIELGRLTVIIGPQASGKSVISKLIYFFNDILSRQFQFLEDEKPISLFYSDINDEFKKWFPPSAWGGKKFSIIYSSGDYHAKIVRRGSKSLPRDEITFSASPLFESAYMTFTDRYRAAKIRAKGRKSSDDEFDRELESLWRVRSAAEEDLKQALGIDYVRWQTFVPAGRSFFTSIGKAVAAFDQGGMLDPVTIRFGRLFTSLRERGGTRLYERTTLPEERNRRTEIMKVLFGGSIRFGRDRDFVETPDGREVPFSVLSSGQQELLPLWLALGITVSPSSDNRITYIEEPEAHLFPSAQSTIIEYLASTISGTNIGRRMLITTHSPYVLAKINNLIKAGQLGNHKALNSAVNAIVPRISWLSPGMVKSYALKNRYSESILDDDGLIDATYVDEVSGDISREFSELIGLEISR